MVDIQSFSKRCVALALVLPYWVNAQSFSGTLLDAVQLALRYNQSVAAGQAQIQVSEGVQLAGRAPFDVIWTAGVSNQNRSTPVPATDGASLVADQLIYQAGVSRLMPTGTVLSSVISVNRLNDNYTNYTAPSSGNVALNVTVPLRRGSDSSVVMAPLTAAGFSLQASRNAFRYAKALAVVRTTNAYWDLVAASHTLALNLQAEVRAEDLLANARKLARADEIPQADLLKYQARKVAQESNRIGAELQLSQARQALAAAMNLPIEIVESPSVSLDAFPLAEKSGIELLNDPTSLALLLNSSLERRADLQSARETLRAANTLADAARRNSGTQLDLGFSVGYNGMTEGRTGLATLNSLGQSVRGINAGISLNATLAGGEYERRGQILQREAAAVQAQIDFDALSLRAATEISLQIEALRTALAQLRRADAQRRLQATIFENEKRSYQAGLSTLLDLFTNESQLTAYQISWVQAQRNFAQALVSFRFLTGTLLGNPGEQIEGAQGELLQIGSLITLPSDIKN